MADCRPNAPIRNSSRTRIGYQSSPGCLIAFGLLFGGIGSIFSVLFFLLPLMRALDANKWVEVPCTILESRLGERHNNDGTTYRVEVRYAYHFPPGDRENDPTAPRYESARYDFFKGMYSSGLDEKRAEVERLKPGTRTTCRVDPTSPDHAVLKVGTPEGLGFMLLILLFPLAGFALVVGGIVDVIRGRRRKAGLVGMSAGAPTTTTPSAPEDLQGPMELQPAQGRFATLVSIGSIALVWNGLVWPVILVELLPELRKGNWVAWFPLLFLSIFVIVGLFLIVVFILQLLAMTNPRLRLIVNRHTFRPGEMLELEWECLGNPARPTSLTIALEGRESATYCRGTDTTTETHVFARLPLARLDAAVAIMGGRTKLQLPADTVPTFIANCNKIEWILIVRGVIPRWADICDDYPVTILPPRTAP